MAVAYLKKPYVANIGIDPNRVYANSPFRPYAGFNFEQTSYQNLMDQQIIRGISSPFSINDQNVINAIRRQQGFSNDGRYEMGQAIGGAVGTVVGLTTFAAISAGTSKGLIAIAPAAFSNPFTAIGWSALMALSIAGTATTSYYLGSAIGGAVASPEGQYAMTKYLSNLGNSMIRRPVTTVLNTATMISIPIVTSRIGISNPYLSQLITMGGMKATNWLGSELDNQFFGELSENESLGYTDLMALQGDLADNLSGTTLIKAALASGGKSNGLELIAKAYGVHQEGFDPLDFNDVRESYNIDTGNILLNSVIDMMGEVVFDVDNLGGSLNKSSGKNLSKSLTGLTIEKIIKDPELMKLFGDDPKKVIESFGSKKLERIISEFAKEYEVAKTKGDIEVSKRNEKKLNDLINKLLIDELKKASSVSKANQKNALKNIETITKFDEIKKTVLSTFEENINIITKQAKQVNEITNKIDRNKRFLNFDTAILKEFKLGRIELDSIGISRLYLNNKLYGLYSDINDNQMRMVGWFTKPFQSLVKSKPGRWLLNKSLQKLNDAFSAVKSKTSDMTEAISQKEYDDIITKIDGYQKEVKEYIDKEKDLFIKANLSTDEFKNIEDMVNELSRLKELEKQVIDPNEKTLIEKQLKDLTQQIKETRDTHLEKLNYRNNDLFQMLEALEIRYKELESIKKEMEKIKGVDVIYTQKDGSKTKIFIDSDTKFKEIQEEYSKLLTTPGHDVGYADSLKEVMKQYEALQNFNKMNKEALQIYLRIINFDQKYMFQYTSIYDAFFKMQKGIIDLQVMEETQKKQLIGLSEDNQQARIREIENDIQLKRISLIQKDVSEIAKRLELPQEIALKMVQDIQRNIYDIRMHPGSIVTTILNEMIDKEERLFNNNPELLSAFNKIFLRHNEVGSTKKSLKEILMIMELNDFTKTIDFNNELTLFRYEKLVVPYLKNIIERIDWRYFSISEKEGNRLKKDLMKKENLDKLIASWIHLAKTNKTVLQESVKNGEVLDKITYAQDFGKLDKIGLQYAAMNFLVDNNIIPRDEVKFVDSSLKILNDALKELLDNTPLEERPRFLNAVYRKIGSLKSSKLMFALNAGYFKQGFMRDIIVDTNDFSDLKVKNGNEINTIVKEVVGENTQEMNILDKMIELLPEDLEQDVKDVFIKSKEKIEKMDRYNLSKDAPSKDSIDTQTYNEVYKIVDSLKINPGESKQDFKNRKKSITKQLFSKLIELNEAINKTYTESGIQESDIDKGSPYYKLSATNSFLSRYLPTDIPIIVKGETEYRSDRIDPDKSPSFDLIKNFMKANNPTEENIIKLLLSDEVFYTSSNRRVKLTHMSQIPKEDRPVKWKEAEFKSYSTDDEKVMIRFFKNIKTNKDGSYSKFVENIINLPYSIRNNFYKKLDVSYEEYKKENLINEDLGSLEKEVIKTISNNVNITKIEIGKNKKGYTFRTSSNRTEYIAIKVFTKTSGVEQSFDLFIPKMSIIYMDQNNKKVPLETYFINGQRYMKRTSMDNKIAIIDSFRKVFSEELHYVSENNSEPLYSNREIFKIFYGNSPYEEQEGGFSNLMWLPQDNLGNFNLTSIGRMMLSNALYLTEEDKMNLLGENADKIIEEWNNKNIDTGISQPSPTMVTQKVTLMDENGNEINESFFKLYNVGWNLTEDISRLQIGAMNPKNAIPYVDKDTKQQVEPLIQNKLFNLEQNKWAKETGGFNAKVSIVNNSYTKDGMSVYQLLQKYGVSTFEDGIIMSQSAYDKYYPSTDLGDKERRRPVKAVDRYSDKGAITVIPDQAFEDYSRIFLSDGFVPEVLLSEKGMSKRDLKATALEVLMTQKNKLNPNEITYVESGEMEKGIEDIETKLMDINNRSGFLYMYKMEIGDGKSKATKGSPNRDSSALTDEDLHVFNEVKYLTKNGESIDPNGEIFRAFTKRGFISTHNDDRMLGKEGYIAEQFRYHQPYSNSMVIRHNTKLKPNEVSVPERNLIEMGIIKMRDGKPLLDKNGKIQFISKEAGQVLVVRRPTKGRESFIYANIVVSDLEGDMALGLGAAMTAGPNADFDYDNAQFFSLQGINEKTTSIIKNAFSHDYKEEDDYSDMNVFETKKYNMNQNDEDIVKASELDDNKQPINISNNFKNLQKTKEPTEIMKRTNFVKRYTPLVRSLTDTIFQEFNLNPEARDIFDKRIKQSVTLGKGETQDRININKGDSLLISFLKQKGIKLESKIGRVKSFEHLRRMLNDVFTQNTVDYGKHGNEEVRKSIEKLYNFFSDKSITINFRLERMVMILPSLRVALLDKKNPTYIVELTDYLIKQANRMSEAMTKEKSHMIFPRVEAPTPKSVTKESEIKKSVEDYKKQEIKKMFKDNDLKIEDNQVDQLSKTSMNQPTSGSKYTFDLSGFKNSLDDGTVSTNVFSLLKSFIIFKDQISLKRKQTSEFIAIENYYIRALKEIIQRAIISGEEDMTLIKINDDEEGIKLYDIFEFRVFNPVTEELDLISTKDGIASLRGNGKVFVQFNSEFNLENINSFTVENKYNQAEQNRIDKRLNQLYISSMGAIDKVFKQRGIDRRNSVNPEIQGMLIFKSNLIRNILVDMYEQNYDPKKGLSIIGGLLNRTMTDEVKEKISKMFKPFMLYQTVINYLHKNNERNNVVTEIALMDGIFDNSQKMNKQSLKSDKQKVIWLQKSGFLSKGETLQNFKDYLGTSDIDEYFDIINIILENIGSSRYLGDITKVSQYEDKYNLIKKINFIRKNGQVDGFDPLMNKLYNTDDIISIQKGELSNENLAEFEKIINQITSVVLAHTQEYKQKELINKEVLQISSLKTFTAEATREFIKTAKSTVAYENELVAKGLITKNDPGATRITFTTASEINKHDSEVIKKWYKLTKSWDEKVVDSELATLRKNNKAQNLKQSISSLTTIYPLDGDPQKFVAALEKELNEPMFVHAPKEMMQLLIYVNKMLSKIGNYRAINYMGLLSVMESMKSGKAPLYQLPDGSYEQIELYREALNYQGYEISKDNHELQKDIEEFEIFLNQSGLNQEYNLKQKAFANIMLILSMEHGELIKNSMKPLNQNERSNKIIETIAHLENQEREYSKHKDNTSSDKTDVLIEDNTLIRNLNLHDIEKVREKLKAYNERPIVRKQESSILDTYEYAKFFSKNNIEAYSLFNVYQQLYNLDLDTEEKIETEINRLLDETIGKDRNFKMRGLRKLHTGLVDSIINWKVMEKLSDDPSKISDDNMKQIVEEWKMNKDNFIIFDTENIIDESKIKKFYELSYITFENGKPKYHQFFFHQDINTLTETWLKKDKKWTDEDVNKLKELLNNQDFNTAIRELTAFVELLKTRKIVGHAVNSQTEGFGEVDKINNLIESLYKRQLKSEIARNNLDEMDFLNKENIELKDIHEFIKDNKSLNTLEKLNVIKTIILDQHYEELEKSLNWDERVLSTEEETYKENLSKTLEYLLSTRDANDIIAFIRKTFNLSQTDGRKLYTIYNQALTKLINKGFIYDRIPKVKKVVENGKEIIKIVFEDEVKKQNTTIKYDEDDMFAVGKFKQRAFYESGLRDTLKEMMTIHGMKAKDYFKISRTNKNFDNFLLNNYIVRNVDDIRLNQALDVLYSLPEGSLEYVKAYNQALGVYNKIYNVSNDENKLFDEMDFNQDKIENIIKKQPTITDDKIEQLAIEKLDQIIKERMGYQKGDKTPERIKLETRVEYVAMNLFKLDFNNLDMNDIKSLLDIGDDEIVREMTTRLIQVYNEIKLNGYTTDFYDGTKRPGVFEYETSLDDTFKKLAWYNIIYSDEGYVLRQIFGEKDIEIEAFERSDDPTRQAFYNKIDAFNKMLKTKHEDEFNKQSFTDARLKLKQMIFESVKSDNWDNVLEYIKNNPEYVKGTWDDIKVDELLKALKTAYYDRFNELKTNGLIRKEMKPVFEDNNFKEYSDGNKVIKYSTEKVIDETFKKRAVESLIKHMNEILWTERIKDFSDQDNPKDSRTSYSEYNNSPIKYMIEYSDLKLGNETFDYKQKRKEYSKPLDNLYKRKNKIERLRGLQYDLFNFIRAYKYGQGKYDYDFDAILKEIKEGFLGKNFKLTIIRDLYDSENQKLKPVGNYTQDDLNNLPIDLQSYISNSDILDVKNTAMSVLDIKTVEDLKQLIIYMNDNPESYIGFTTNFEMIKASEINYEGYQMPKGISLLYNSILTIQKMTMLLNPGFIMRNVMDAIQRNYALVFEKGLISGTIDFVRESQRTAELDHKYEKFMHISYEEALGYQSELESLKNNATYEQVIASRKMVTDKLELQINQLTKYNDKFITSKNTKDHFNKIIDGLRFYLIQLNNLKDTKLNADEVSNLIKKVGSMYIRQTLVDRIIMNSHLENSKIDLDNDSKEKIEDLIYFMRVITDIERSGPISDAYENKDRERFAKIFEDAEDFEGNLFQMIYKGVREITEGENGFAKIVNPFGRINQKVERWQRIHGILLDMRVNGLTRIESYNNSLKRFFNYGRKSEYESAATAFFPFASFAIRNLDYTLDMLNNPKYMRLMSNVAQAQRAMYDAMEENDQTSTFFNYLARQNNWLPISNNTALKTSNALYEGMGLINNPYEEGYQKLNPMIQQINNMTHGKDFDFVKGLGANNNLFVNAFNVFNNIRQGNTNSPADFESSMFYEDNFEKYTPYKYRNQYGDYRNLQRDLFFPDGSRRTPSRNPYTNAKNILYKNFVNAKLMNKYRRNR